MSDGYRNRPSDEYNSLERIRSSIRQVKTSIEILENELEALDRVVSGSRVFDSEGESLTIGDNVYFIGRVALPGSPYKRPDVTGTVCHITDHFVHVEVFKYDEATQATNRKVIKRASKNLVKIGRNTNVINF